MLIVVGTVIVMAIAGAGLAIALSGNTSSTSVDAAFYDDIPKSRTEDGAFVLGNPDAPFTVVEFSDFLCPHCQDYEPVIDQFIRDYVATGKAKFEYRMLPAVDPTNSYYTAQLAECANTLKPGSFWVAHDVMFDLTTNSRFNPTTTPRTFADRMGIEYGDLLQCSTTAEQVFTDRSVAQKMEVSGTPAVLVRYGDGDMQWISGKPERGAPQYDMLAALADAAQ